MYPIRINSKMVFFRGIAQFAKGLLLPHVSTLHIRNISAVFGELV